jgi:hypothetical protein
MGVAGGIAAARWVNLNKRHKSPTESTIPPSLGGSCVQPVQGRSDIIARTVWRGGSSWS